MVIIKTTESGQVETTDITSARLLIESEKLAQAVDDLPKRLKACAEAWGRHSEHLQC